jgi:hypothetical protein
MEAKDIRYKAPRTTVEAFGPDARSAVAIQHYCRPGASPIRIAVIVLAAVFAAIYLWAPL